MQKFLILALALASCKVSQTPHRNTNRFCAIIGNVKYLDNGKANVQPRGMRYWFRYPNRNIWIGDTVELSMTNRIEPKF
jgi:hypothetical protein